jgi:L-threonylcarbamoyladenylate synthase
LPRTYLAKDYITGRQNNVGLRVPAQPIALALLKKYEELGGHGVAAPSANRFGAVSPTTAEAVGEELNNFMDSKDLILDGGVCSVGIESTIIDCTGAKPRILRFGAVTQESIEKITQEEVEGLFPDSGVKVSGQLKFHYAPKARIFFNAKAKPGSGFIALERIETPANCIRLASPINMTQFAKELYSSFRKADKLQIKEVYVEINNTNGIGLAVIDRVLKASNKF